MKRFIYLLFINITGISMYSCDNREADIAPLNAAPEVFFNGQKTTYEDSVKISLKNQYKSSEFQLTFLDKNRNLKEVKYSVDGNGNIMQDGKELTNNSLNLTGKHLISFSPTQIGLHKISFTATDRAGKSSKAVANIYAFNNLPPVAKIKANEVKVLSPFEFELDASASIDQDQQYGGGIFLYTYFVNGKKIVETDKSKIKYIFPETGNYSIQVTVKDLDGDTNTDSRQVTIN